MAVSVKNWLSVGRFQRETLSKSSCFCSKNLLSHFESITKEEISKLFLNICIFTISGHFCWKWLSPKQFFQRKIFEVEFEKFSRKLNTLQKSKRQLFQTKQLEKIKVEKKSNFRKNQKLWKSYLIWTKGPCVGKR